jgi:hypothetical protein
VQRSVPVITYNPGLLGASRRSRQNPLVTSSIRKRLFGSALLGIAIPLLAGCGAAARSAVQGNSALSITPGISTLDTNCTGCNATNNRGEPVHRLAALLANGSQAAVTWSVSGGDRIAGPGRIDAEGRYTPPGYLTADHADVLVTARLASDSQVTATARLTITPGFLQPLTPENAALGPGGTLTVSGKLAIAGGETGIHFSLQTGSETAATNAGALSVPSCEHSEKAFTTCSVTYTAPASIPGNSVVYVIAHAAGPGGSSSQTKTAILLNAAGVTSNPVLHQGLLPTSMPLGGSGGNNGDFDAHGSTIADCCSGTLGALVADNAGRQYILSNNHVLARSDHAAVGDAIVQPGLIDNNCTPNGAGPGTVPVASLFAWAPLKSNGTNVDAAIAQVASHTVDESGKIMELGARQPDGLLAAASPGVSSSNGRGESATLQMRVAKSGRTTGLTCGAISAIDVDMAVDYFSDCAETRPYLSKVFTNQIAISGDRFSDAGDSGALIVNTANAEPLGLFFAGGTDPQGVGQAVANPAPDVLNELAAAAGGGLTFSYVGGADHPVSCVNYGNSTVRRAQMLALSDAEIQRSQQALFNARELVSPANGILGVGMGKSSDQPGTAAVLIYIADGEKQPIPATIDGVRTVVISATPEQVALGAAPLDNGESAVTLTPAALNRALRVKQQIARGLMRGNKAFFGVGVGQSLDNPREPALVIYVNRNLLPSNLPQSLGGIRTRYLVMDRLHVTRSYATGISSPRHCMPHHADSGEWVRPRGIDFP